MTPIQKRNIGIGAILCCLFFDIQYFAITFEPKFYPGTNISYHTYCAANRIVCPYCLWWFIGLCIAIIGSLYFNQKHYSEKIKEERGISIFFEFLILLKGNLLYDLLRKIRHPELDCLELTGEQIVYTMMCVVALLCRLYPKKAKKVWSTIKFIATGRVIVYLIRKLFSIFKRNK